MPPTILLVDDDEILSQVLRRVLTRAGYAVHEAGTSAQALEIAAEHRPDLALLDLRLPDGDGIALGRQLLEKLGPLPLILMTAYPLRLRDQPELARGFSQVLTKPLNLDELRQVIDRVLHQASSSSRTPSPASRTAPVFSGHPPEPAASLGPRRPRRWLRLLVVCLVLAALLGAGAAWKHRDDLRGLFEPVQSSRPEPPQSGSRLTELPNEIQLSPQTARTMAIQSERVPRIVPSRTLSLVGSLTFNPARLASVKSLFSGKVIAVGTTRDPSVSPSSLSRERPLRYGDFVKEDQLLAVVLSSSLGEKKNDLVNALIKLHLDEVVLASYEELSQKGNLPRTQLRQHRATVAQDRNEVERSRLSLRTWGVDRKEIAAVEEEAKEIFRREGKRDLEKETEWARVEVRAPFDGIIAEMSVPLGSIVDTSWDLFKVADINQLGVMVHAYEEDLATLRGLPAGYHWTVRTLADPRSANRKKEQADTRLDSAGIQQLGMIVDPTQHTAPVLGLVDNADHKLFVGQFITASIDLPAPDDIVAVPVAAISTTGSESVVFVQPDPSVPRYVRRRVLVQSRLEKLAYVRSRLTQKQKQDGIGVIEPGELLVVAGVVELEAALDDLQTRSKSHK